MALATIKEQRDLGRSTIPRGRGNPQKTIQTTIVVDQEGKATIQLTPDVSPGPHYAVVVIDEPAATHSQPTMADFPRHEIPWPFPEGFTFRREEIYGDDGR